MKRWEMLVKVGDKTHRQVIKADTFVLAAWALEQWLADLEDEHAFSEGTSLDASVRPVKS